MKKDNWILKAFLMTFFIALFFNGASNLIIEKCSYIALIILLISFVFIGVFFDIIGTAVLTAKEATFHAKNSKKIKGAVESIKLIKSQNQIASICNDIIGDICGIISGSITAMLSIYISNHLNISIILITLILCSLVSSITVGCKAIGKKYAINNSDKIIEQVGKFISLIK